MIIEGSFGSPFSLGAVVDVEATKTSLDRSLLAWVMTALAAWLLAHPYAGLRHDGVLYLGQVLHYLGVGDLQHDVFFAHGSQKKKKEQEKKTKKKKQQKTNQKKRNKKE